jgi:hypothetical protein
MRCRAIKPDYLIVLASLFVFSFCTKQVAGPKGEKGTPGKKGNLTQSQRSVTVADSSWAFNGGWWKTTVYVPEITSTVIAKGEVKAYMKIGTEWWSLPYAVGDKFMQLTIESGMLHLDYTEIHGGPPPAPGERSFRIVTFAPV